MLKLHCSYLQRNGSTQASFCDFTDLYCIYIAPRVSFPKSTCSHSKMHFCCCCCGGLSDTDSLFLSLLHCNSRNVHSAPPGEADSLNFLNPLFKTEPQQRLPFFHITYSTVDVWTHLLIH